MLKKLTAKTANATKKKKVLELRKYQKIGLNALYDYFRNNKTGSPLLVFPPGTGKSLLVAEFTKQVLTKWPKQRILILTHVRELIIQNFEELAGQWPLAPAGIYSAGLNKKDIFDPIIFAGIQSIYKKAMQLGKFNICMIDECHLINPKQTGMYRQFINDMKEINPKVKIIGLTATDFRTGSGDITHGKDAIFTDIAYKVEWLDMIKQGYLVPFISKKMIGEIDTSRFHIRAGEFIKKEVEQAFDHKDITHNAIDEVLKYAKNRKSWLVFCASIDHANHVAKIMNDRGIETGCITSETLKDERDFLTKSYKSGEIKALTNANVLTTGFNAKTTDLLILLRATASPGLYVQIMGRGNRTLGKDIEESIKNGKADTLVLDFGGNVRRHGPVDQVKAWIPEKRKKGAAPMKDCPECQSILPASTRICPDCGHEFEFKVKDKHEKTAGTEAILSTDEEKAKYTDKISVNYINYDVHHSQKTGIPLLKVEYKGEYSGIIAIDWVCFEHGGLFRMKAVMWWKKRVKGAAIEWPVPSTVDDALKTIKEIGIKEPSSITVNPKGRFTEIVGYDFKRRSTPATAYIEDDIPF